MKGTNIIIIAVKQYHASGGLFSKETPPFLEKRRKGKIMFCNHNNNGCCCRPRNCGGVTVFERIRSITRPTGPTGANGASAATSFGSFYNTTEQEVNNTSFPIANTQQAVGMTLAPATGIVTLTESGIYKIDYGVYVASGATAADRVAIFLNGVEVAGTSRGLENNTMIDGNAIVQVPAAGNTINIQIISSNDVNFLDNDGINGYLIIVKIA